MTGADQKNYHSIVSERWKKMKENPARMIRYNNKAKQIRIEAEKVKPTKSGDDQHDPSVGCMVQHEEMVTERPAVKKYRHSPKNHQSPQSLLTPFKRTQTMMEKGTKISRVSRNEFR